MAGSGVAVAALLIGSAAYDPAALHPVVVPLTSPDLPLLPAAAILLGLLPAFAVSAPTAAPSEEETS